MIKRRNFLAAVLSLTVLAGTVAVPVDTAHAADGETVIYSTDFSDYTESGKYPDKKWGMGAWYSWMNDPENIESTFGPVSGAYGKDADDTSLNLNNIYKKPYGSYPNKNFARNVMLTLNESLGGKNVLRVSFSVAQSIMQKKWKANGEGAGINADIYFRTANGEPSKTVLCWFAPKKLGAFGTFFDFESRDGKWLNYDYIFYADSGKADVYINGCKVLSGYNSGVKNITGIKELRFLLVDVDNGEDVREEDICIDDVLISALDESPKISPVSSIGDRARLDAPELAKYVNHDAGVIYNYGQSFSEMQQYIPESSKLIAEELGSTTGWQMVSDYNSNSLDAIKLNDGRTVSPSIYIDGEYTPFCYAVRQPSSTRMKAEIADIGESSVRIEWRDTAEDSAYVEIFRGDELIGRADSADGGFTDDNLEPNTVYEYTLREIKTDDNATYFTEPIKTFISSVGRPENFTVQSVPNRVAIRISWSAPKYGTVTGYALYRDGALYKTLGADETEFVDEEGLVTGTTYTYSLAALNGTDQSDRTTEISALAAIILAPKNVTASEESGKISISWDAVEDAAEYEVYANGEKVTETAECSYLFEGEYDTLYRFSVKAVNSDGFASENSDEKYYMIKNPELQTVYSIFTDALGSNISLNSDGAETEADSIYACMGKRGVGMTFAPTGNDAGTAGFKRSGNYDLSALRSGGAEIRFLINIPEGADTKNLSFGAAQAYTSKVAGASVTLRASVGLDKYLSGSGWQTVRIPVSDLPSNGSYKAAYMPYEAEFDYSKTEELGIISEMQGMAESALIMVDEMEILSAAAPTVKSVTAGGIELAANTKISGKTREFEIAFAQAMDSKTVNSATVTITKDNAQIPTVAEFDEKSGVYKISLLENLETDAEYTFKIEKAVSADGVMMAAAFTRKFVTDGETNSDAPSKSFDLGTTKASGKNGSAVSFKLNLPETLKNEKISGLSLEISYDTKMLRTSKSDVKLAAELTKGGAAAEIGNGKVKITRSENSEQPLEIGSDMGKILFEILAAGSSDVKLRGTVTLAYGETAKKVELSGVMTVTGSGAGGNGGGNVVNPPSNTGLSDISGVEWAREAIEYLHKNKIISGYEDNTFRPDNSITREEFAAIAVRAFGLSKDGAEADFSDTVRGEWYYPFVASAAVSGAISGKDDGSFGVGETITRQDMCTILVRIADGMGTNLGEKYERLEFVDNAEIADYAAAAVTALQRAGIINGTGDNMFSPQGEVSRAMAAKAVYGMLAAVNSLGGTANGAN